MTERERILDTALLQSGKFKEALHSLLQWMSDTEDLVSSLKPPATDYKVLKTQLQEQKVCFTYQPVANLTFFLVKIT